MEKIEDGSVHGTAEDLSGAGTVAVSVLSFEEVSQMPLISDPEVPSWLVVAPLPIDQWAVAIYGEVGTFVASRTQAMTKAGLGGPQVEIEVVAPDADIAKERVAALGSRVNRSVSANELSARPVAAKNEGI